MFSFSYKKTFGTNSLCGIGRDRQHYVYVLLFLSAIFLLMGCPIDPDDDDDRGVVGLDPRLIGTWLVSGDGWSETYEITSTHLTFTGFASWGGSIAYAAELTNNTGIIIIEYDQDKKQEWTNWTTMDDITPEGNFYGIYYRNLSHNSVVLSNTSDQAHGWGPSETTSLQQAISRFGFHNMADWISMDAGTTPYTKLQE